ncbi:MAG TPA: alpha/beta family hydrolase [Acidisarcina sp.]|nr:alpha/beta family hydrolase [Acidisarcina sp.]
MTTTHIGSAQLRSVELRGPAGRLEALLNAGREDAPYCVLVCHPHPLGGGTLHNKVVFHTMKAFQSFGLPVLRFNFRGTGLSEGTHDDGRGERDDVRTALDWLDHEFARPILFAGFSFGAAVGLEACCGDPRVKGLVGLGLPVHAEGRDYTYGFLPHCTQPKLFVSGSRDQYGPKDGVEAVVHTAAPPVQLVWIEGADHFFTGKLDALQAAIRTWLESNFALGDKGATPELGSR